MLRKIRICFMLFVFTLLHTVNVNGFIRDWLVVGPFHTDMPEELLWTEFIEREDNLTFREGEFVSGKKCIKYNSKENLIDLCKVFPKEDIKKNTVCYAVSYVSFDNEVSVNLFTGSDDFIIVYVNGVPVHMYERDRRNVLPVVDLVENVKFQKGWNQILVKAANRVGGYSFFLCLTDEKNNILNFDENTVSLDKAISYRLDTGKIKGALTKGVGKGTSVHHWPSLISSNIKNPDKVTIGIDKNEIINDQFKGIGFQGDFFSYLRKASKKDRKMLTERVKKLKPSIVRLFLMTKWWYPKKDVYEWDSREMKDLYEVLDLHKSVGAEIILTIWRPFTYYADRNSELADSVSKLMNQLLNEKGYDNIKYLMIYNEPDMEFRGSFDDYTHLYSLLNEALKKEGIRDKIKLVGPDDALSFKWFEQAVDKMDNLIDVYDSHHYESYDALSSIWWIDKRLNKLSAKGIKKPWFICEFGMGGHKERELFYYGIFAAEYVITGLNKGASGMSFWHMQSMPFANNEGFNDHGLWGFKYTKWHAKPVYFAYGILTRNLRSGMKVIKSESSSEKVISLVLKSADEKIILLVSNRNNSTEIEVSGEFNKDSSFKKYLYDSKVLDIKDDNMIQPTIVKLNNEGKLIDNLEELSFILYVQE